MKEERQYQPIFFFLKGYSFSDAWISRGAALFQEYVCTYSAIIRVRATRCSILSGAAFSVEQLYDVRIANDYALL